ASARAGWSPTLRNARATSSSRRRLSIVRASPPSARSAGDQSTGRSSAIASAMRVVAKRASTTFASVAIAVRLADRLRHALQRTRDRHAHRIDAAADLERDLLPRQAELDTQHHQFLLAPVERRERVLVGAQALLADELLDR